jgi:hypothetical protein
VPKRRAELAGEAGGGERVGVAAFDKISLHAVNRLSIFLANHHQRDRRFGRWAVARSDPNHLGLIDLNGTIVPPRPHRPRHRTG